jgi:mRNA interferase MazF
MGEYQRGEVVLVRFPFTDLSATKLRPAVVLAIHGDDVIVVGVFSRVPPTLKDTWLRLDERDPAFSQTGLKTSSVIKGEKLAVVHRSIMVTAIGSLPAHHILTAVSQRVKQALRLP